MNSVTITGVDGKVYWGYHLVGLVRNWTATRSPDAGVLHGTLVSYNTFRASQHPLVFVVQHKHGTWRWPIGALQISGQAMSASLLPQETDHAVPRPTSGDTPSLALE